MGVVVSFALFLVGNVGWFVSFASRREGGLFAWNCLQVFARGADQRDTDGGEFTTYVKYEYY